MARLDKSLAVTLFKLNYDESKQKSVAARIEEELARIQELDKQVCERHVLVHDKNGDRVPNYNSIGAEEFPVQVFLRKSGTSRAKIEAKKLSGTGLGAIGEAALVARRLGLAGKKMDKEGTVQWMWADAALLQGLESFAQQNPLRWSERCEPKDLAAQLAAMDENRPVRLAGLHLVSPKEFCSPNDAATWLLEQQTGDAGAVKESRQQGVAVTPIPMEADCREHAVSTTTRPRSWPMAFAIFIVVVLLAFIFRHLPYF